MKNKIIEKMASIMCGHDCEDCAKETVEWRGVSFEEAKAVQCLIKKQAELLYNADCRIIPEDSVVINKNAKIQLVSKIKEMSFPEDGCGWDCVYIRDLVDLLKEFNLIVESGVEE